MSEFKKIKNQCKIKLYLEKKDQMQINFKRKVLLVFQVPLESVCLIDKYSWLETDRNLGDQLIARLGKNMTVPLAVIR